MCSHPTNLKSNVIRHVEHQRIEIIVHCLNLCVNGNMNNQCSKDLKLNSPQSLVYRHHGLAMLLFHLGLHSTLKRSAHSSFLRILQYIVRPKTCGREREPQLDFQPISVFLYVCQSKSRFGSLSPYIVHKDFPIYHHQ